jgi:SAM-dependent methyltransferase
VIATRTFPSYDDYIARQGGKAVRLREKLLRHLPNQTRSFAQIFRDAAPYLLAGPVLCLGARTGAESLGAVEAGFPGSVGIDLHPVGPTVIRGDWHQIPFPDRSFANVYSNSLDHCLHLDRLAAEVQRVLIHGGRFYVMATNREKSLAEWQADTGGNEGLYWQTSDDLCEAICGLGFLQIHGWRDGKWGHDVLQVRA